MMLTAFGASWPAALASLGILRAQYLATFIVLASPFYRLIVWWFIPQFVSTIDRRFDCIADCIAVGCLLACVGRDLLAVRAMVYHPAHRHQRHQFHSATDMIGVIVTDQQIIDVREAGAVLEKLENERWASRGQGRPYGRLTPSIDRGWLARVSRRGKLQLERRSIELFRRAAQSFAPGEEGAQGDDFIALMVLRHYGAPTRLLDWTRHPSVAAYFACSPPDDEDGEVWAFDYEAYERLGKQK